jgi:hypothetical protein
MDLRSDCVGTPLPCTDESDQQNSVGCAHGGTGAKLADQRAELGGDLLPVGVLHGGCSLPRARLRGSALDLLVVREPGALI